MDTIALFGIITTRRLLEYPCLNHTQDLSFARSAIINTQLAISLIVIKNGAPSMVMENFRLSKTSKNPKERTSTESMAVLWPSQNGYLRPKGTKEASRGKASSKPTSIR